VIEAALARGLTNPIRANAFVGALVHQISRDSALRITEAIRLGANFRSFQPSRLASYTLPVVDARQYKGLTGVLLPKRPQADRVVDRFLGRQPPAQPARGPDGPLTVSVLNALGTQGSPPGPPPPCSGPATGWRRSATRPAPAAAPPRSAMLPAA
jgi:hypothetical protein